MDQGLKSHSLAPVQGGDGLAIRKGRAGLAGDGVGGHDGVTQRLAFASTGELTAFIVGDLAP